MKKDTYLPKKSRLDFSLTNIMLLIMAIWLFIVPLFPLYYWAIRTEIGYHYLLEILDTAHFMSTAPTPLPLMYLFILFLFINAVITLVLSILLINKKLPIMVADIFIALGVVFSLGYTCIRYTFATRDSIPVTVLTTFTFLIALAIAVIYYKKRYKEIIALKL